MIGEPARWRQFRTSTRSSGWRTFDELHEITLGELLDERGLDLPSVGRAGLVRAVVEAHGDLRSDELAVTLAVMERAGEGVEVLRLRSPGRIQRTTNIYLLQDDGGVVIYETGSVGDRASPTFPAFKPRDKNTESSSSARHL